jgi:hypothetical protein
MPIGQTNTTRIEGRGIRSFALIARTRRRRLVGQARAEITNLARVELHATIPSPIGTSRQTSCRIRSSPQAHRRLSRNWSLLGAAAGPVDCVVKRRESVAGRVRSVEREKSAFESRWVRTAGGHPQLLVESVAIAAIGGVLSVPLVMAASLSSIG